MKNIEIEIQVKVENIKPLLNFLKKSGEFKSEEKQIDEYFTPIHRDFLAIKPVKEWLRLRNSNGTFSINYKNWQYNKKGEGLYADEYETKIVDLEKVKAIFKMLNFKTLVAVDKKRKIWTFFGGLVSIVLAVIGIVGKIEIWLTFLGTVFAPIIGIVLANQYVIRKDFSALQFNWLALLAWLVGVGVSFVPFGIPILQAMAASLFISTLFLCDFD